MSLSKNERPSVCPCCDHQSLRLHGAFMMCETCGLAIRTPALVRAARHTEDSVLKKVIIESTH